MSREQLKEKEYAAFLANKFPSQEQEKKTQNYSVFKVARPMSAAVQTGLMDPQAMSEDARLWLRQVESSEKADDAFWSKKAPNKSKMWFDPCIPDSAFAADAPVVDHRQVAAKRTTTETNKYHERPQELFWTSD